MLVMLGPGIAGLVHYSASASSLRLGKFFADTVILDRLKVSASFRALARTARRQELCTRLALVSGLRVPSPEKCGNFWCGSESSVLFASQGQEALNIFSIFKKRQICSASQSEKMQTDITKCAPNSKQTTMETRSACCEPKMITIETEHTGQWRLRDNQQLQSRRHSECGRRLCPVIHVATRTPPDVTTIQRRVCRQRPRGG